MDNRFDGFAVNLYLDDERAWLAHLVELPEVSAFGISPEVALAELANAWEAVKATYSDEDPEMQQFQADLLESVRQMKARCAARTTVVRCEKTTQSVMSAAEIAQKNNGNRPIRSGQDT